MVRGDLVMAANAEVVARVNGYEVEECTTMRRRASDAVLESTRHVQVADMPESWSVKHHLLNVHGAPASGFGRLYHVMPAGQHADVRDGDRFAVLRGQGAPKLICPVGVGDGAPRHNSKAECIMAGRVVEVHVKQGGHLGGEEFTCEDTDLAKENATVRCFAEFAVCYGVVDLSTDLCGDVAYKLRDNEVNPPVDRSRLAPDVTLDGVFVWEVACSFENDLHGLR